MSRLRTVYCRCLGLIENVLPTRVQPFWNHPAGPKTIFFWAPTFKWGLVIAGASDFMRPVEKLSAPQYTSLTATGAVWSRYSLVIIPKNWNLFSVNCLLMMVGFVQIARITLYKTSHRDQTSQAT